VAAGVRTLADLLNARDTMGFIQVCANFSAFWSQNAAF
jgi:hypothetical protein